MQTLWKRLQRDLELKSMICWAIWEKHQKFLQQEFNLNVQWHLKKFGVWQWKKWFFWKGEESTRILGA